MIFVLFALAVFRVTWFVVEDSLAFSLRNFVFLHAERYKFFSFLENLISCGWCLGVWVSAAFTIGLWITLGSLVLPVFWWLAGATVTGVLFDVLHRLDR